MLRSLLRNPWVDFAVFLITAWLAYLLGWQLRELVWGLWLSSLVVGYLTIFSPLFHGGAILPKIWKDRDLLKSATPRDKVLAFCVGFPILILVGVFYFGFISFHFGFFHFIHGVFLDAFFPLDGIKASKGTSYLAKVPSIFKITWPFVLLSIVSSRDDIWGGMTKKGSTLGPYRNVIKMHLMIICFFGPASMFKWDHWVIYMGVLVVYFFPWHIFDSLKSKENGHGNQP